MAKQLLTTLRRERTSLTAVPTLQFVGALRLVAHVVTYRGIANAHRIKQDFIFSLVQLKEGVQPLMGIHAMHNDTGFLLDQL